MPETQTFSSQTKRGVDRPTFCFSSLLILVSNIQKTEDLTLRASYPAFLSLLGDLKPPWISAAMSLQFAAVPTIPFSTPNSQVQDRLPLITIVVLYFSLSYNILLILPRFHTYVQCILIILVSHSSIPSPLKFDPFPHVHKNCNNS